MFASSIVKFALRILYLSFFLNMSSISMSANTGVASDLNIAPPVQNGDINETISSSEVVSSGSVTVEKPYQSIPPSILSDVLCRKTKIYTQALSSVHTPNTNLVSFSPYYQFFTNVVIADKIKNFAAWRGTLRLTISSTFPSGTYGLFCVSACANGGTDSGTVNERAALIPYEQAFHVPHVPIRVEQATDGILDLPFIYPYDYASFGEYSIWRIQIFCLQPVTSAMADATLSGDVTIFAQFMPDYQLVIPIQQGKKVAEFMSEKNKSRGTAAKNLTKTVGDIASKLSMVPVIGPLAGTVATGAAAVHSVLDFFGFTRETSLSPPIRTTYRALSNVSTCDGEDTSEVAALFSANATSIDPRVGGGDGTDETAFPFIYDHWTQVAQFTWTNADTGDLGEVKVSPFFQDSYTGTELNLTSAGYVGLPFTYWRGSMRYKIVIPVSQFHRGVLQICWSGSPGVSITGDATNQLHNIMYDVTADQEIEFTVGYSKTEPVSESVVLSNTFPAISQTSWYNGGLLFKVINRLTAPVDTAPAYIRVYAKAEPDMRFGVPKTHDWGVAEGVLAAYPFFFTWVPQGAVGDEDVEEEDTVLVPTGGEYPVSDLLWGEDIVSVRALVQKPCRVWSAMDPNNQIRLHDQYQFANFIEHFPTMFNPWFGSTMVAVPTFNFGGYYRLLYVGCAGSVRWKIMNTGTAGGRFITISAAPDFSRLLQTNATDITAMMANPATPEMMTKACEAHEVLVPYYHNAKFIRNRFLTNYTASGWTAAEHRFDFLASGVAAGDDGAFGYIYQSFGPDVRFNNYRFPPTLVRSALTTPPYPQFLDT